MSNLLVAVVGVVLFIALALAGVLFLGSEFRGMRRDAEVSNLVSQREQIIAAYEMRKAQTGMPLATSFGPADLATLHAEGYLKQVPPGIDGPWWMVQNGVAMTVLGSGGEGLKVCVQARERLGLPNPSVVLACDDPAILDSDPCCVVPGS